jgi:hypothetical protein
MKNTTMDDQTGRTKYVDIGGGRIAYMEVIRKLGVRQRLSASPFRALMPHVPLSVSWWLSANPR